MNTGQTKIETPTLIETGQGFSVLYKNRYLYSRYAPNAASRKLVQNASFLPSSLIFCFSPVLDYGLDDVLTKAGEDSLVVAVETDKSLYDFTLERLDSRFTDNPRFIYVYTPSSCDFVSFMTQHPAVSDFARYKRCVFLDMSGAVQLSEFLYTEIKQLAADFIANYWKNRVTLIKLGRLFSRNVFRNLSSIPTSAFLRPQSVFKPFLVLGAGPSLDTLLPLLREHADDFFILAVDSALVPLLKQGIKPDAVIALESQLANEKAFIGASSCGVPLIADLTSRPSVTRLTGGPVAFVCSLYTDVSFLRQITSQLAGVPVFPTLGSVGLAAIETALFLRSHSSVPVYFAGLDFSYIPAKTHCREAPALRNALNVHTRLESLENPAPAYREGNFVFTGKDGLPAVSNPALAGYGKLLGARYASAPHVFDISPSGMNTGCPRLDMTQAFDTAAEMTAQRKEAAKKGGDADTKSLPEFCLPADTQRERALEETISRYYQSETETLESLKTKLSSGADCLEQICSLISERQYLYLHFPDGHLGLQTTPSFLKRVRSEIDFFLKDLRVGMKNLS